jgi:hypothetical protein
MLANFTQRSVPAAADRQHEKRDELEDWKWWVTQRERRRGAISPAGLRQPIGRKELSKLKPLDVERWLFSQIPDEDEVEELESAG